jgi:hypothetical protein
MRLIRACARLVCWRSGRHVAIWLLRSVCVALGFEVEEVRVRARGGGKGTRHTIWMAKRKMRT